MVGCLYNSLSSARNESVSDKEKINTAIQPMFLCEKKRGYLVRGGGGGGGGEQTTTKFATNMEIRVPTSLGNCANVHREIFFLHGILGEERRWNVLN